MLSETQIAGLAFILFWPLLTIIILIAGRWSERVRRFGNQMTAQWRPALAIALLTLLSIGLSGRGLINPYPITVFCEALIGLVFAQHITGYEPLAVARSIIYRRSPARGILLLVVISLLLALVGVLVGTVGVGVVRQILHETYNARQASGAFPLSKGQAFFYFLWGAGIAEETTYRLVLLSLVWWLTRRKWLAILLSAILFAAYHLTPLSGSYLTFWQFPISQLVSSTLIGLVWGYVFVKRGYETAVLAHALSDWIPVVLFMP